jgi:hypothetical protein
MKAARLKDVAVASAVASLRLAGAARAGTDTRHARIGASDAPSASLRCAGFAGRCARGAAIRKAAGTGTSLRCASVAGRRSGGAAVRDAASASASVRPASVAGLARSAAAHGRSRCATLCRRSACSAASIWTQTTSSVCTSEGRSATRIGIRRASARRIAATATSRADCAPSTTA